MSLDERRQLARLLAELDGPAACPDGRVRTGRRARTARP